jgi:hypothetical protein
MKMPSTLRFKPGDRVIHDSDGKCVVHRVSVHKNGEVLYFISPKGRNPFWSFDAYLKAAPESRSWSWDEENI